MSKYCFRSGDTRKIHLISMMFNPLKPTVDIRRVAKVAESYVYVAKSTE
jgi:hypothetical protein